MMKSVKNAGIFPLSSNTLDIPALHPVGLWLAAMGSERCPVYSLADRVFPPAICTASLPSPCSVATGESGCQ